MQWLKQLFRERTKPETEAKPETLARPEAPSVPAADPVPDASDKEPVFSRMTPNPKPAPPGQERSTFLAKVGDILADGAEPIDTGKLLQEDYGLDELGVSECVQIAEEVWAVQLMPNPMRMSDYDHMLRRFPTLAAIIQEAEGVAAERHSGR
jgi:hypothetical protein